MEKLVYLLGDAEPGRVPRARGDLRDALLAAGPALAQAGVRRASFTVAELDDALTDRVYQRNVYGLIDAKVSPWLDSLDERKHVEGVLDPLAARKAFETEQGGRRFRVEEVYLNSADFVGGSTVQLMEITSL